MRIQAVLFALLVLFLLVSAFLSYALWVALIFLFLIIGLFVKTNFPFFFRDTGTHHFNEGSVMNHNQKYNQDNRPYSKKSFPADLTEDEEDLDALQIKSGSERDDQARLVDDTQASILFNKTADSIIDLIHHTLNAHSAFFYLYNYQEPELILQCYRSQNSNFTRRSSLPMGNPEQHSNMRFFHEVADTRELKLIQISEPDLPLPYYTGTVSVQTLMLTPLLRRGTLLGILGVDHTAPGAFSDFHIQLMHKYVGLLRHSIHSIDAVFVKNRLTRISSAIKDYGEHIRNADHEDKILLRLRPTIRTVLEYGRFSLWMYNHKTQTLVLFDTESGKNVPAMESAQQRHILERHVIQTRQSLYIPSVTEYVFPHGLDRDLISSQYLTSVLCVPVIDQDHCFGVLTLEIDDKNALDIHQIQFMESLCHIAGLATARVYLDQSLATEISSDPLTGIDNQSSFLKKINAEIYRSKRFNTTFSLLLLEIEHLDRITEQYGNRFRHFILEKAAQIIRHSLRQVDIAARLDNDRLAIILIESQLNQTQDCAFRIKKQIQMAPFEIDDILIPVRAITGFAQFGPHGDTVELLFQSADYSLQQPKSGGNS